MAAAEVGDDVYGEDRSVNALEEVFAARAGKQAALCVPSGTNGQPRGAAHPDQPGTIVVAGRRQHVVIYEAVVNEDQVVLAAEVTQEANTVQSSGRWRTRTADSAV